MASTNYNISNLPRGGLSVDVYSPAHGQHGVNSTSLENSSEVWPTTDLPPMKQNIKGLIILMYTVICVVAIIGNGCVIYLVLSRRQMRNVTNYFIASLATSDMLMAIVCIPVTFIANVLLDYWPFPAAMCPLVTYLQVVIVFQNAYTLLAISLERYIAIMYPFQRRLTTYQCFVVIALCWFLAMATPLPTAITSRLQQFQGEEANETLSACYEVWLTESQRFTYSITIMVLQYFVPLVVLTYTYARIVHVVWLKDVVPQIPHLQPARPVFMHRESARRVDTKTGKVMDPRKKVIKMMITVVGIYAVCWLPLHVITILGDTRPEIWQMDSTRYVWISAHWLAMSACVYNPIIYWWMSDRFRHGYKSLLRTIKIYCCVRGRDRMGLLLSERRNTFDTSGSYGYGYGTEIPRVRSEKQEDLFTKTETKHCQMDSCIVPRESMEHIFDGVVADKSYHGQRETTHNGLSYKGQVEHGEFEAIPLRRLSDELPESGLGTDEARSANA